MDRDRLKDIRQTDLTEGRINQDFVDWLKSTGTTWLLVIVIGLFGYAMLVKWRNARVNRQTEAWTELSSASLPSSLEDVASKYGDVGAVAHLANLRAAELLMRSVQSGKALAAPNETAANLTAEQREEYLNRADRLFSSVASADDQSNNMALIAATALSGRGAVAESRGRISEASALYEQAAQRAQTMYPEFAQAARERAADANRYTAAVQLPTRTELTQWQQQQWSTMPQTEPVWSEPWITDSILPKP